MARINPKCCSRAALAAIVLTTLTGASARALATGPRLVLQITVDQLRGDLPTRYADRLGAGGFRYLWEQGTVYLDAHHAHGFYPDKSDISKKPDNGRKECHDKTQKVFS